MGHAIAAARYHGKRGGYIASALPCVEPALRQGSAHPAQTEPVERNVQATPGVAQKQRSLIEPAPAKASPVERDRHGDVCMACGLLQSRCDQRSQGAGDLGSALVLEPAQGHGQFATVPVGSVGRHNGRRRSPAASAHDRARTGDRLGAARTRRIERVQRLGTRRAQTGPRAHLGCARITGRAVRHKEKITESLPHAPVIVPACLGLRIFPAWPHPRWPVLRSRPGRTQIRKKRFFPNAARHLGLAELRRGLAVHTRSAADGRFGFFEN